ncbi:hypothetical protein D3C80_1136760 [compost metagenome]
MVLLQVVAKQLVLALLRPPPRPSDQRAQTLVTGQVLYQQHQLGAALQKHLAAHDQPQLVLFGSLPCPNNASQGAFVSDRQGLVALLTRAPEQLVSARRPALEAEVGQAMQLGITRRAHANHPCSHSGPAWPRSR